MESCMFFEQNQEQTIGQMAQIHYYHNYYPQPTQFHAYYPPRESVVIDSLEAAKKYNGFVVCEHKKRAPAPTKPQARAPAPRLVHHPRVVNEAGPKPSSNYLVSYVVNQDLKPQPMMSQPMMPGSNTVVVPRIWKPFTLQTPESSVPGREEGTMWKLRTSSSSSVQCVQPSHTFPTAALIDYVVRRERRPSKLVHKNSFLVADSFSPDPVNESESYFGAPADDCVDLKAANYILQRRLSLESVDSE